MKFRKYRKKGRKLISKPVAKVKRAVRNLEAKQKARDAASPYEWTRTGGSDLIRVKKRK